jgi:hypothetical protein
MMVRLLQDLLAVVTGQFTGCRYRTVYWLSLQDSLLSVATGLTLLAALALLAALTLLLGLLLGLLLLAALLLLLLRTTITTGGTDHGSGHLGGGVHLYSNARFLS